MKIKLVSTSRPKNSDVKGTLDQVYASNHWKQSLVDSIYVRYASFMVRPDLRVHTGHVFASNIRRRFDGVAVGVAKNSSDAQDKFLLRYILLKKVQFSRAVDERNAFVSSNRAPEPIPVKIFKGTLWKGMPSLHFGLWPTIVTLYHGQGVPDVNILSDKGKEAIKELGPAYLHWASENIMACKQAEHIQALTDKMVAGQQKKHLFPPGDDWPLAENGNNVDFPFVQSSNHPKIAAQRCTFFAPTAAPKIYATLASIGASGSAEALEGATIQVSSFEDNKNDVSSKIGQAKNQLYLAGAVFDWVKGTVSGFVFLMLSSSLKLFTSKHAPHVQT